MSNKKIRFIHFADLHLGVETYGTIDSDTGFSSRMLDILSSLDYLVDYAINNKIDMVVFCGDAYKDRSPNPTQQRELAKRIKRLSQNGIATFMLTGNHDLPNAINRATATEIFDTLAVDNVHVTSKPGIHTISTPGGKIQIIAVPWLRRTNLMSREDVKNLDMASIVKKMEDIMTRVIMGYVEKLNPDIPAILALHVWVKGAKIGTEKGSTIGREPEILVSNITRPELDYVALGHIHRRQELSQSPPVVYPGSLVKLDFSDKDEDKGFYVIEITTLENGHRQTRYRFEPVPGRPFKTIRVELEQNDIEPTTTIVQAINQHRNELGNAIVRLEISLPQEMEGLLRNTEIREALKPAHFVTTAREVRRSTKTRFAQYDSVEAITPTEALQSWLNSVNLPDEQKKQILEYGTNLIEENITGV